MSRPGMILYFELLEPLKKLSDEDRGKLVIAMLEYGKEGIEPELDGVLALTWGFIRPKLDRDKGAYENSKLQRKYAVFCKKRAGLGLEKIPFEDWQDMTEEDRIRAATGLNETQRKQRPVNFVPSRYPSITETVIIPVSKTITETGTVAVAEAEEDGCGSDGEEDSNVNVLGGELGKDVVFLSKAQIDDLLEQMGIDTFDYYVDKLSNFIIRNGANVKNHYETILKWWKEDARLQSRRKQKVPTGATGLGASELEQLQREYRGLIGEDG